MTAKDPLGNIYKYSYNAMGLVATETLPNGDINRFSYDPSDAEQKSYTNPAPPIAQSWQTQQSQTFLGALLGPQPQNQGPPIVSAR